MYRIIIACSVICLFISSGAISNANAASPVLTSENWSVSLGKPVFNDPNLSKPIPNKSNMYSLRIKNNGKNVFNVRVQAFRDEPGSQTQLQLLTSDILQSWESGKEFTLHQNLPVSVKANDIEVVVFWETAEDQDKISHGNKTARTWKQSFHFKQKALQN